MKLGDLTIGGGWKVALIKGALFLVALGAVWWFWRDYRQAQQAVADLELQQYEIEQQYQALQVRVEESRIRTERRLEAVVQQAQDYANDSDMSVLVSDLNAELDRWRSGQVRTGD